MHRLFLAILEWNFLPQDTSPESAWLLLCLSIEEVLEAQCLQRRRGRSRSRPFVPYGSETQPWRCAFLYIANQFALSVSVCVCVCLLYSILHSVALFICIPNSVATTSDDTLPCHPETITSLLKTGYTHTIVLLTWLHGLMWYQRIFLWNKQGGSFLVVSFSKACFKMKKTKEETTTKLVVSYN